MTTLEGARKSGGRAHYKGPEELVQAAAVARRFYLDGKTKVEIAAEFGISRFKVARALETALKDGIVRIEILLPTDLNAESSDLLRTRFGLSHAIVVNSPKGESQEPGAIAKLLGAVAADFLAEIIEEGEVLGLVWGPEIDALGAEITKLARCTVVQLSGASPLHPVDAHSVEAVRRAASISRGFAYPLYAPLFLPDQASAQMLRRQPGVVETVRQFDHVTKAIVTVGAWLPGLSTVYDSLTECEREEYNRRGACGEVAAHVFDSGGQFIAPELTERVISISIDELHRVPDAILLTGGVERAAATAAALKTGLFSGIITDSGVADRLLE